MYTLYWSHNSASIVSHYCLEEAGAPYDLILVDMAQEAHKKPDFLKVNPAGKLPALKLPDGSIISECAAITLLIADRFPQSGLAPAADDPKRGAFLMWLFHLNNTLQPAMLRYYYPDRITTEAAGTGAVQEKAKEEIAMLWSRIDDHLAKSGPYLLGNTFSAADPLLYMLSTWQECCPDLYKRFLSVRRHAEKVRARPAIARVAELNEVGPVAA
ncbi:glutathione S-transferase family protein [Dongia rigui]|uniref:Glutathione S-transferase family protein n=1 Tax=Dongia rigui TaxID=940149 RepID=A0ABU5DX52_9PROT|nr:glutathione S-transferase family protein [Dongia rigui]MDY0871892.1 glutathione S-transferase family protein [Dongia rigui]